MIDFDTNCTCGDVADEHYFDGEYKECLVEGCPCIYFDPVEDEDEDLLRY